jgi:hypothetical protein
MPATLFVLNDSEGLINKPAVSKPDVFKKLRLLVMIARLITHQVTKIWDYMIIPHAGLK